MKKVLILFLMAVPLFVNAQVKLHLDSQLLKAYEARYHWGENLICVPFYCDPFYEHLYKKGDTNGLCGRYVFVDRQYNVRIKPGFDLPCWFEPRFSEGLCAVSMDNRIVFIDTAGKVRIKTDLTACSAQKNKVLPFRNGLAKVYRGGQTLKHYYEVYYIDRNGKRQTQEVLVKVKPRPPKVDKRRDAVIAAVPAENTPETPSVPVLLSDMPVSRQGGKYHPEGPEAEKLLRSGKVRNNLLLLYYNCGGWQTEHMSMEDTVYCGKWVFADTQFNVRIARGFALPCAFEPEFSEGLCAVSVDSFITYIDTLGRPVLKTALKACSPENNKASTFKNGIATLYSGDPVVKGLYTTVAINTKGERVRLLEFDDLELAELKLEQFSNLGAEEARNCFVGRGKTNGIWFLVEKSGKIRKKLEPRLK